MVPSMIMRLASLMAVCYVSVLSDDMFGMGQALAGGVLDAPALPRWRPFDLRPHLSVDEQVISFAVDAVDLDHAVASLSVIFCSSFS